MLGFSPVSGRAISGGPATPSVAISLTPGVNALAITGLAPSVSVAAGVAVTAGTGAASLTGAAPTVAAGASAVPGVGSAVLAGQAPSFGSTSNASLTPGVGALAATGAAPTVTMVAPGVTITAGAGALHFATFAPTFGFRAGNFPGAALPLLRGKVPTVGIINPAPDPGHNRRGFLASQSPMPNIPLTNPATGVIDPVWQRWLLDQQRADPHITALLMS